MAREDRVALFSGLGRTDVPGWWKFELSVDATENVLSDEDVRAYFTRVVVPAADQIPV